MNIKYCCLFILALTVCVAESQPLDVGFKAGVSIPNLSTGGTDTPINSGYSSRFGPGGSIFAEVPLVGIISIAPAVEYSSQGGKKDGLQALDTPAQFAPLFPAGSAPQYLYANYNSTAELDYLMVPVLAKFNFGSEDSPLRFYAAPGPFAGLLLSAKQVTSGSSQLYFDPAGTQPLTEAGTQQFNQTQDIKSSLHTFNAGIEGNIGVAYGFGRNSVRVEGGGDYGFINIQKGTENGKNFTGAATASIAYAYAIGE